MQEVVVRAFSDMVFDMTASGFRFALVISLFAAVGGKDSTGSIRRG